MELHPGDYIEFCEDGPDRRTERYDLNTDLAEIVDLMRCQEMRKQAICRDNVPTEDGMGIIDGAVVGILTVPEAGEPHIFYWKVSK